MAESRESVKTIFGKALEIRSEEERARYLDQACAADDSLRSEIEDLLGAIGRAGEFLIGSPPPSPTVESPITEKPGTQIGPYKLLQQLGEGGMGVVYLAEQKEPVKRRVALKIIKPGMDTRQVIARFEAERQALAMMDHPNIAKVLDAGQTESGRPYFVMELVKGMPVTKYCDEQHLTPKERLELFVPICQAVQHAHQKGIIHRDLKPSNILVALYDGQPVPKIIDFGVAKATSQTLTEKSMFTQLGQVVGTLEYMAPEQAQVNQLDVDTRSDVYSLGVVLYELLTGETPFDRERLRCAAFDEMLRIIREEEPSKPSTKVSSSQSLPSIAASRRMEPAKLGSMIRGELDWIVLKAMEKDRGRRYETASKFAEDVQHYLNDEAVVACPPSIGYKFRKFAHRYRAQLATAGVLALALLVAVGGVGWAVRDRIARAEEVTRKRVAERKRLIQLVDPLLKEIEVLIAEDNWSQALEVGNRAAAAISTGQPGEIDEATKRRVHKVLSDLELVRDLDEASLKVRPITKEATGGLDWGDVDREYSRIFHEIGIDVLDISLDEAAAELQTYPRILRPLAYALVNWCAAQSRSDVATRRHLLDIADAIDPNPQRRQIRAILNNETTYALHELLPKVSAIAGKIDVDDVSPYTIRLLLSAYPTYSARKDEVAQEFIREVQQHYSSDFWFNHSRALMLHDEQPSEAIGFWRACLALKPGDTAVMLLLADALQREGRPSDAIPYLRKAIELRPDYVVALNYLGRILASKGNLATASDCFRKATEVDPHYAEAHSGLGDVLYFQGQLDEAVASYRNAIDLDPTYVEAHDHLGTALYDLGKMNEAVVAYHKAEQLNPKNALVYFNLGNALRFGQGKLSEAEEAYRKAVELFENDEAADLSRWADTHSNLATLIVELQGDIEKAEFHFRRAVELAPKRPLFLMNLGLWLRRRGQLVEAVEVFRRGIDQLPDSPEVRTQYQALFANLCSSLLELGKPREAVSLIRETPPISPQFDANLRNNVAWYLATCENESLRDADEAVSLSCQAIELVPDQAGYRNTLGTALYRAGEWKKSIAALEESNRRTQGGTAFDWFFLAMAQRQLGEKELADTWYEKAVQWMDKHQPENEELLRFREEAMSLLSDQDAQQGQNPAEKISEQKTGR